MRCCDCVSMANLVSLMKRVTSSRISEEGGNGEGEGGGGGCEVSSPFALCLGFFSIRVKRNFSCSFVIFFIRVQPLLFFCTASLKSGGPLFDFILVIFLISCSCLVLMY